MKREDLRAGNDYLVCTRDDWANPERKFERSRVRVLTLDPWDRPRFRSRGKVTAVTETGAYDVPDAYFPVPLGSGVLVEILDKATGKPLDFSVVQLSAIRGEWAKAWGTLEAAIAEARAEQVRKQDKRDAESAELEQLAEKLGGRATRYYNGNEISLTAEQARTLLERLG